MPRPSATARKSHNHRHENGAVGPGKKVFKQKSNGHLNGAGSVSSSGPSSQVDLPSSRSSSEPTISSTTSSANKVSGAADGSKSDGSAGAISDGSNKANADMSSGQPDVPASQNGVLPGEAVCHTERAANMTKRTSSCATINPVHLASTILKSCPMYDTIAILIFLLQLPPMVLTLVQILFASLTFMPPSGASSGSLTSNFDIFQGPAGTPSLGTMIAMDGFCLLFWGLFMWTWAQNFALDLAHVQVAITLGGGGSGKNGGVNALLVGIVLLLNIVRSKGVQDFVLEHLFSTKVVSPDVLSRYSHFVPSEIRRREPQTSPSWIRSLLAVHILAQAGTAMARRSMARNRSTAPSRFGKRGDTEASTGSQTVPDLAFESTASVSSFVGSDGQMVTSASLKDGRDRLSSAKRRKRQANQVRSRQPFWAALASTKVTVLREYEHSRALSKISRGLAITEEDLQGVTLEDGLIWITDVDGSSIQFAVGDFSTAGDACRPGSSETVQMDDEDSVPFYVCVNGALWASVTITRVRLAPKGDSTVQWRGEISGLAPNCAYTCTFVRSDTDEEVCVMSVKTPAAGDMEQVTTLVSVPPQPSYRPSSPTSTLKNSIVNAETKLNEKRSRLKKAKNDHKLLISKIKKELDNYNHRLHSGTDEHRQKQRSLQLERNIRQTEEATAELELQLDHLENEPDKELEDWSNQKESYERQLEFLDSIKEDIASGRTALARDVSSLESELSSMIQRRERLQSRRTRVNEQYERILSANAQGLNERERRAAEQFAREQEHAKLEITFNEQIASISQSVQDVQMHTSQLWQQASAIEQAIQQQQQQMLKESGPLTPEGNLPGTNPLSEVNIMSSGPSGSRSLLAPSLSALKSSSLQNSSSPLHVMSSQPASPEEQSTVAQPFPAWSLANSSPYLTSEFAHRNRSHSNRSTRSSQFGTEMVDSGRPPFLIDLPEVDSDKRRSLGSEGSGPLSAGLRSTACPFPRAASRGSGSGSGSGFASGSASPSSSRGKSTLA